MYLYCFLKDLGHCLIVEKTKIKIVLHVQIPLVCKTPNKTKTLVIHVPKYIFLVGV